MAPMSVNKDHPARPLVASEDADKANVWVRFGPIIFILLPLVDVDVFYRMSMAMCQRIVSLVVRVLLLTTTITTTTPTTTEPFVVLLPAVLFASFLSGVSNKITDLIDDEGFLAQHQGTSWLFMLQVVLKVYFPGFFVLMFVHNQYAAAILAATYFFAWIIRGKVGQPSKALETIICVAFLPVAWSLVGGCLFFGNVMDASHNHHGPTFAHTFIVVLVAHAIWLRVILSKKSRHVFVQNYPYTYILMTDLGMFRYLPVLALACVNIVMSEGNKDRTNTADVGNEMFLGTIIIAMDNLGYYLTKSMWKKYTQCSIPPSHISGSSSSSSNKPDSSGNTTFMIENNITI